MILTDFEIEIKNKIIMNLYDNEINHTVSKINHGGS